MSPRRCSQETSGFPRLISTRSLEGAVRLPLLFIFRYEYWRKWLTWSYSRSFFEEHCGSFKFVRHFRSSVHFQSFANGINTPRWWLRQIIDSTVLNISKTIAAAVVTVEPGAMRYALGSLKSMSKH